MVNVMDYGKLIYLIAYSKKFRDILNPEDLEQDLFEKLLGTVPYLESRPKAEEKLLVGSILNNHATSQLRFELKRTCSEFLPEDVDVLEMLTTGMDVQPKMIDEVTGFEILSATQMVRRLGQWTYQQDDETIHFIHQSLEPSPGVMLLWKQRQKETPRLKHYSTIPPLTLGKILGISKIKVRNILAKVDYLFSKYELH